MDHDQLPDRRRLSIPPPSLSRYPVSRMAARAAPLPMVSLPFHHTRDDAEDAAEAPRYTGESFIVRIIRPETVVEVRLPADVIRRYEDEAAEVLHYLAEGSFPRLVEVEATNISRPIPAAGPFAANRRNPLRRTYYIIGGEGWGSPPRRRALYPPAAARDAVDVVSTCSLDVLLGYSRTAMGVMLVEIKVLKDGWGAATQAAFVFAACTALASLGIGVFTAGYTGNMTRRISVFCGRLSTLLFTALLIILTSCQFGRTTCVAGGYIAGAVATGMSTVWAFGGLSSMASAISSFWGRLRGRQGNRNSPRV